MSVVVKDLVKIFGEQKAVNNISFEAKKGEVLGFLGPNGAGKSTTMRIIGGFIPPNAGVVEVCGIDVEKDSIQSRTKIGYLPEANPLYFDMYVKEFLHFVSNIHKIPNKKKRIEEIIELTGLEREQKKHIGALSKGYKQRVGLAQAMIHDPEVLILDEPTSGLDPNQLAEIRGLIRNLGQEKTVIFSTHIMQEVEAICDRVVIINRGNLVANAQLVDLHKKHQEELTLRLRVDKDLDTHILMNLEGVQEVKALGMNRYAVSLSKDVRSKVASTVLEKGYGLEEMVATEISMESIFRKLTN